MGDFNLALVIVAIVLCIIVFVFNVYLLVNYQHPDDKNQAYFPKFVVVLGLSVAAISILMLPADVANRQACRHAIYNGACNLTLPMKDLWLAIYILDAVLVFFIIPFAMFYYEGDQDKSVGKRIGSALLWVGVTAIVCALVLGILYGLVGKVDFTIRHLSSSTASFSSFDFSSSNECINGAKACSAYLASDTSEKTWTMRTTFPEYVVALATIVGSVLFTIFGGIGIACLPLGLIFSFIRRPKAVITRSQYIKEATELGKKAKELKKAADALHQEERGGSKGRKWRKNVKAVEKELLQLEEDVKLLEEVYPQGEKAETAWAMTVLGYLAKLVLALDMAPNTSESDIPRFRDDDFDSANKSGSDNPEGGSGDDQENPRPKKKRYHRHTQHQIQEMEAFFKECPHPDDKQRKELSRELGLEPLQVKFWFQNKRTQMKTQHERHENTQLRNENEKLRADNMRYREALGNASCPNCGGPTALGEMSFDEHHLRLENARLREEIDSISAIAAKYVGKPLGTYPLMSSPVPSRGQLDLGVGSFGGQPGMGGEMYGAGDLLRSISAPSEADKPMIIELAVAAMEELFRMAQMGEPLWMTSFDGTTTVLNEDEYIRTFPRGIGPKQNGFKTEASRESAVVIMNHINLVEILMDVNQWSTVFSGIVSRALTLEVLSSGVAGNYNGALQVMTAEFQVPSPLVPTRESYYVRYCKQHADGTWAVVDVSLDDLRPNPAPRSCQRRPSGCLIQEMPNGYSKVTWVEHAEVDERGVHNLYKQLVSSGHAFGAKRWVATLDRQCERLASAMASNITTGDIGVITNQEGRKSMLKLAERMVISFCSGVSASTTHTWTTLSGTGADDVRVMTRKSVDDPGRPPGIVLSAATSFWLPVPPKRVFEFLRDENSRSEWDILSNGGIVQEMAHIANGRDTGNCVSLLRVNSANSSQSNMLILQESCTDPTASFVIYAPVDIVAMNVVLNGSDPDYVALLPSGFAILPDGTGIGDSGSGGGSLLTVAFQILVDSVPTAKLSLGSVATVNNLIACTVERIKAALSCDNA